MARDVTPLPGGRAARPPLFKHPGRVAITVGTLFAVVNILIFAGISADTSNQTGRGTLPAEIVAVSPEPGTLVKPQQSVDVVLRGDLTGVLRIDGSEIPEDQLLHETQSSIAFDPGPGKDIVRFRPGAHRVEVVYWPQVRTREDAKSYAFMFTVTA